MNHTKGFARNTYIFRINRVQDYIKQHLDTDLSLKTLANVACFSTFYFNRVFQAMVGESLNAFVSRHRVEASAFKLINNPQQTVTAIAYDHGFSSPSVYSRTFKKRYLTSPTQWRKQKGKICKASSEHDLYSNASTKQLLRSNQMQSKVHHDVDVRKMEAIKIAYIRHRGHYDPTDKTLFQGLFKQLLAWAMPLGIFSPPETKAMTVFSSGHPEVTEPDNLCVDVAISIQEARSTDHAVNVRTIPAGDYAVIHLKDVTVDESATAWDFLFKTWLPQSGYEPGDGAYYINHLNDPEQHPQQLHHLEMFLPVKPLAV